MLAEPTLVLNKNWVAIQTTTVRNALSLLYTGGAKVINTDTFEPHDFESWTDLAVARDTDCVKTVSLKIRVPEVILLQNYDRIPKREVTFSRRNLYRRDRYTCQYCGCTPGSAELSIDHVMPRSKGGRTTWTNCVLACIKCNKRKGSRTLAEAHMKLLTQPVKPKWSPHVLIPLFRKKQSWDRFVSDKYWDTELID